MRTARHNSDVVRQAGFSLVELLVVMAIVVLLMAIVVPAVSTVFRAGELGRAGRVLADEIALARQEAVARQRDVEVRFVQLPGHGNEEALRAVQLWIADERGVMAPHRPLQRFPGAVVVAAADGLSPLLDPGATGHATRQGQDQFGSEGTRSWRGFRFRGSGTLDQGQINTGNNFITLAAETDLAGGAANAGPPANYYAVRINPATGRVSTHQP